MLLLTVRESWVKILVLLYYVMLIYDGVLSSALGLFTAVFEKLRNFKYPWNVDIYMVIFVLGASVFLHVVQVLFRVKQLFKSITRKSTPRLENYEWLGVWDSMGEYPGQWAPPVLELHSQTSAESRKTSKTFGKRMVSPG